MEGVKRAFTKCREEHRAALVTYVTAGYPTVEGSPDIMLGLQAGGAGMLATRLCDNTESHTGVLQLNRYHRAWCPVYRPAH